MSEESSQEKTRRYWNTEQGIRRSSVGGLGGGGQLEVDYRDYFEWKHLQRIVHFDRNMSLLELGCGKGRWAIVLAPMVAQYDGVDFSEISLEAARLAIKERGIENVHFHCCSVTDFPCDRQYDVIYLAAITQYLNDEDVKRTLDHLSPCFKPTTLIVERSTIRYNRREVRDRPGMCYAVYRTPEEIKALFEAYGFRLCYQKRSYRFLRGFGLLNRFVFRGPLAPLRRGLEVLIRITTPVSLYIMLWFSVIADIVWPVTWNKGDGSHDFFLFQKEESP